MRYALACLLTCVAAGCWGDFEDAAELVIVLPQEDGGEGELINVSEPGIDPDAPLDPGKPTIVITHGANALSGLVWYTYPQVMAQAIYERCPGTFNLVVWDYNRGTFFAPPYEGPLLNGNDQGRRLAEALLDRGVGVEIQMIGHSQGCQVIAAAAQELGWADQLTLLDPTLTRDGRVYGVAPSVEYAGEVENYWAAPPTGFGHPVELAGIFNRQVTETPRTQVPLLAVAPILAHVNVMLYYLDTIRDPSLSDGFNRSVFVDRCGG
jgi:pimeloyl-ACP methyl ester carboxylesterase